MGVMVKLSRIVSTGMALNFAIRFADAAVNDEYKTITIKSHGEENIVYENVNSDNSIVTRFLLCSERIILL